MKKIVLLFIVFSSVLCLKAQDSFRQKFLEANTLMEESQYNIALPVWLELEKEDPSNFNVNYKIGVCYIKSLNEKKKALSYLVKAVQNTTNNYDPFSSGEKRSPVESYFYLARAYHINYDLDAAMVNYNSFKGKISEKHYLYNEVDHHVEQCKNAKIAVENPVNTIIKNMGDIINSPYADYSPILSVDESTMYFTSRRIRNDSSNYFIKDISDGKHFEDIYVSHNYDGAWTKPELLGINTEGHEATLNLSTDGQTLFIYKDDNGDGNIYISKLEGEEWSSPFKLGSDINLTSKETHAHVSPDGEFLYFVSDRKGGHGNQDIYYCKRLPTGQWAKAQNIGAVINTPYDEDGIFIHPDGKTMYFSSKGHSSIGGYDIFYSVKDDVGNWSKPVNMGYPVNSTDNDVFFVTSTDGKRGYYSSFQEKGYGEKDIYQISLEDADSKPVTLLTGFMKVKGEPDLPDNAQVVITDNETGDLVGIYKPRKKDGKFSIILAPDKDYHIAYSASSFKQEEDLYIPPISAYKEINRGIDLQEVVFGADGSGGEEQTGGDSDIPSDNLSDGSSTNYNNSGGNTAELDQLRATISTLNAQISSLKTQLAEKGSSNGSDNSIDNTGNNGGDNDPKIASLENVISDLKKQISDLKASKGNSGSPSFNNDYVPGGDIVASYQEYFDYNVKELNTSDTRYVEMVNIAHDRAKSGKDVVIDIESSASKVPTQTYGSNSVLAYKRAQQAKNSIIKSLMSKGVKKNQIVVNNISSNISGPSYRGNSKDKSIFRKFQYIIIKIK